MTEQELIELLETHFPDELTPDIIGRLRTLLRTSPQMRQAILATLKLEQALSAKYARGKHFRVFMRKVQVVAAAQRRASKIKMAIVIAAIVLVVAGGAIIAWLSWKHGGIGNGQIADVSGQPVASGSEGQPKSGRPATTPGGQSSGGEQPGQGGEYNPTDQPLAAAPPWRLYDYPLVIDEKRWRDSLDRMIKPVTGKPLDINESNGLIGLDGKYKFLATPGPERMLRIGLRESGWQINIFSDREGVQLRTQVHDPALTGYIIQRGPDDSAVNCRLYTFDWGLRGLMNYSPLDIYYRDGKITIASGPIAIMSIPLSRPPTVMYFEGKARFNFMEVKPAAEPPAMSGSLPVDTVRNDTPDKFDWKLEPTGGWTYIKGKDGYIEVQGDAKDATRIAMMDYKPEPGDVITFRIDGATAGSGVVIRDLSSGLSYPELVYDCQSQRVLAGNLNDFQMLKRRPAEVAKNLQDGKIVDESFLVRFQIGLYSLTILVSQDGENWWKAWYSHVQNETSIDKLAVGLVTAGGDAKQKIKLSRVTIKKYDAVKKLYDQSLAADVAKLPAFKGVKDIADIGRDLIGAKPSSVPAWKWRSACMAAVMLKPTSAGMRNYCLLELMRNSVRNHYSTDDITTAILQLPMLLTYWNPFTSIENLYDDLAQRMGPDSYQKLFDLWLANIPRQAGVNESTDFITPLMLTREYFIQLWAMQDWEKLRLLSLQLMFYDDKWRGWDYRHQYLYGMYRWLNAMVWMKLPEQGITSPVFAGSWTAPLQAGASRETLNAISEFEMAVQAGEGEFDAAMKVLIRQPLGDDLVPGGLEDQLYSLPETAVRRIIENSPDFQQALKGRLAGLGVIMLNKARQEQDTASMRTVSVLYAGSQCGSDALEYLADRDLLIGNYASAASYYKQLQSAPGHSPRQSVMAKYRLAAAMMGEQAGKPVTSDVDLPGGKLTAREFENVISALGVQQDKSLGNIVADSANIQAPAPSPCEMDFKLLGQVSPVSELVKNNHVYMPVWEQLTAWAPGGDKLFLNSAGKLAAVNPKDAKELWVQQPAFKPLLPDSGYNDYCRPLVAGNEIFTRFLSDGRMNLVCVNAGDGKTKWQNQLDDGVVSDPLIVSPWLYVLTRKNIVGDLVDICLHRISPKTGESVQSTRVFRMRQGNWPLRIGQLTIWGDLLIFRTPGAAVCCDLFGKPRWVRQLPFVPPDVYSAQYQGLQPNPVIVSDGVIYLVAPGCPYVMALELDSGKLVWQFQNGSARRVVGLFGKKLIVATAEELIALDIRSGQCDWRQELPAYDSAVIPADGDSLMVVKLKTAPGTLEGLQDSSYVAWLSVSDGKMLKINKLPDGQFGRAVNLYVYNKAVYGLCRGQSRDSNFIGNVFVLKKK